MEYILRAEGITKRYKDFTALKNVSVELKPKKVYGLIGRNGAGKTTFMRIIAGLGMQTSGNMELFGESEPKKIVKQLKRIGCLIEYPSLNGTMTALENLELHRIMHGIKDKNRCKELLEMVGLENTGKKKVKDFSLGMRQRLGIAVALLGSPDLLILDEPVNGLDPLGVVEIRNLIKDLCEKNGITILISSHNLPELYQTATDYIIIDKGQVKATLTLEELDEKCQKYFSIQCNDVDKLVKVLKEELKTDKFKVIGDNLVHLYGYETEQKMLAELFYKHGIITEKFALEGSTLEDYFISMVGGEKVG